MIETGMATLALRVLAAITVVVASSARAEPGRNVAGSASKAVSRAEKRTRNAQVEFDAVALQALIAPMLAGAKVGPLGSGQAGRYWQSMMAEQIARQIAKSGRLRLLSKVPGASGRDRKFSKAQVNLARGPAVYSPGVPAAWETSLHPAAVTPGAQTK